MIRYSMPSRHLTKVPQSRSSTDGTVTRRRNGLQPACEPCRKAKVRCDNTSTTSVCSRCRKRQTPDICIFLDAPMTGQSSQAPAKAKPRAQSPTSSPRIGAPCLGTPNQNNGYGPPSERGYSSSGFFGSTSFTATIHQATNGLKDVPDYFDDDVQVVGMDCKIGSNVLKQLPSITICERLLGLYETNSGEVGFPKAITNNMLITLRTSYPNIWEGAPEAKDLLNTAREITKNTHIRLSAPDAADEWKAMFSDIIRWEIVGIIFCAFAYGVLSLGEKDVLFSGENGLKMDRKKYVLVMKGCIESCISICQKGPSSVSTLLCNLLYKNLLLETVIHGDSCWPPCQK
jgi:hypothetical protein